MEGCVFVFTGDEKEGETLAYWVVRERATRAVLSTVFLRKSTGEWIRRRLVAWLRENRVEVCGRHRAVRQRASADQFDRAMERAKSNEEWIEADHRERSCWNFEEQWDL